MATQLTSPSDRRSPGRPREFNMDTCLDAAMLVFQQRGYHATSLGDLSAAMKLSAGSIYKAFADKRAIFLAAFDRYKADSNERLQRLLQAEQSGLDKLRAMLRFYADASHGAEGQCGCLVVGAAAELAIFDAEMALRVKRAMQGIESMVLDLVRRGQADGSLAADRDAEGAARTLLCVMQGLRVIGKTERSKAEVMAVVEQALRILT